VPYLDLCRIYRLLRSVVAAVTESAMAQECVPHSGLELVCNDGANHALVCTKLEVDRQQSFVGRLAEWENDGSGVIICSKWVAPLNSLPGLIACV